MKLAGLEWARRARRRAGHLVARRVGAAHAVAAAGDGLDRAPCSTTVRRLAGAPRRRARRLILATFARVAPHRAPGDDRHALRRADDASRSASPRWRSSRPTRRRCRARSWRSLSWPHAARLLRLRRALRALDRAAAARRRQHRSALRVLGPHAGPARRRADAALPRLLPRRAVVGGARHHAPRALPPLRVAPVRAGVAGQGAGRAGAAGARPSGSTSCSPAAGATSSTSSSCAAASSSSPAASRGGTPCSSATAAPSGTSSSATTTSTAPPAATATAAPSSTTCSGSATACSPGPASPPSARSPPSSRRSRRAARSPASRWCGPLVDLGTITLVEHQVPPLLAAGAARARHPGRAVPRRRA